MPRSGRRTWRAGRYAALGLLGLLGLAGVALLIWWVPPALYDYVDNEKDRAAAEASTRTGMIAGLAGLAALVGLAITARTYRLTEQGHITDRFTKAIEQLGADKLDVRLGGIYALERIAVDSKRDHPTIVEVLSAFIREHSHPAHTTDADSTVVRAAQHTPARGWPRRRPKPVDPPRPGQTDKKPRLLTDVQAAVTVLGRLPKRPGVYRGDLTGAQLAGAQLRRANLAGARLEAADLSGARLSGANLAGASLKSANLSGAYLVEANLAGAQLTEANLTGADLFAVDLTGASLEETDLSGAELYAVDLRKTYVLSQAQVDAAHGSKTTQLPDKLRRPASWSRKLPPD